VKAKRDEISPLELFSLLAISKELSNKDNMAMAPIFQTLVDKFLDIFEPFKLNDKDPMLCDFKLKDSCKDKMLMSRGYNLNKDDQVEISKQVQDLVSWGFVEEIPGTEQPQVVSPAMLVNKADGTKRLVVDYGRLNDMVAPCALPLPVMEPMLNSSGPV
jgi:hypothetical protein